MIATVGIVLALATASALPESSEGWVRRDKDELVRILGLRWKAEIDEPPFMNRHPEQWTSPALSEDHGRVYAGTTSGALEARAVSNGSIVWRKDHLGSIGSAITEHRGKVLFSSGSWLIAVDDQTGAERWRADLTGGIGGKLAITGTVAIVPVRSNAYLAIDTEKGEVLWRTRRPTPEGITMRGQAEATIDRAAGRVYLGFSDGVVSAVSLSRGDVLWTSTLAKPGQAFADIDAQPILVDDGRSILAASYAGGLYKLEAASGRTEWKLEDLTHLTGLGLSLASNVLIASHGDGEVLGLAPDSGKVRWRYRLKKGSPIDPVFIGRGLVLVGSSAGPLAVLEIATGKPVQLIAIGSGVSAVPAWRDPDLVVLSNRGTLVALRYGEGIGITP